MSEPEQPDEEEEQYRWVEDETPLVCGLENPELCESCQ